MSHFLNPIDFLARIRSAYGGISVEEIALKLGLKKQALYKWGRGETEPEFNRILLIGEQTGCSLHWLLTGMGPEKIADALDAERLKKTAVIEFLRDTMIKVANELEAELKEKQG